MGRGTVEISREGTIVRPAVPLTRNSRGKVKVATIIFDNGSARLDKRDRGILRDVRRVFDQYRNKGGKVRVIGHASSRTRDMDPVKHKMVNYRVSADRADVVARELMRMGVPAEDIFVGASSDSDPLYFEFMPSGEAGNRRAEIFIDY
ncbi:MAG TPA: OmpA family protein [Rhodospirillales bacterium]|nr:OmpA family protein [Rhodospirillales bacterium]